MSPTNLKTKNNQNCQKNQTVWKSGNKGVKEETFIHTGSRDREGQPGWRGHGKGAAGGPDRQGDWWTRKSHICIQINQEEKLGRQTDLTT